MHDELCDAEIVEHITRKAVLCFAQLKILS